MAGTIQHPDGWDENPDRMQKKDLDARWVKKNGINYYGYKKSICIDVDHGFIRRYAMPRQCNDSHIVPDFLDPDHVNNYFWPDSRYSGECFESLLSLGGFEGLRHERGAFNHPLSNATKKPNRIKSGIRTCVEHVFGSMPMSMRGKLMRKIELERIKAWWGLKNLTFNFRRYLQRTYSIALAA